MQTNFRHRSPRPTRRGFALVIALMLMSFMVVLLLSAGTLTRVQTQAQSSAQLQESARANARLAMLSALGQLQSAAGPDKRATATGETIGKGHPHKRWTGVWATDTESPQPHWLVSGNGEFGSEGSVEFLSFLPTDSRVKAPKVPVPAATGSTAGSATGGYYAWWIGDEGVKAKINVVDPYRSMIPTGGDGSQSVSIGNTSPTEYAKRARYRLLTAQETGSALLLGADNSANSISPCDEATRVNLNKLHHGDQIDMLQGGDAEDAPAISQKALFHDVTVHGHGVLANMRSGGLKTDLSTAFAGNTAAPSGFDQVWWNRLRDFYQKAGQTELTANVDTTGQGQSFFPIPVKVNFMVVMFKGNNASTPETFASGKKGQPIYVGLSVEFSLHNPYNVPLELPHGFQAEVVFPERSGGSSAAGAKGIQVASAYAPDGTPRIVTEQIDELANELTQSGLDNFHVSFKYGQKLTLEPGRTRLFSVTNGGASVPKNKDITGHADGEVVADLNAYVNHSYLDYVYKRALIADSGGDDGLYTEGTIDQTKEVILRLDSASDMQFSLRLGLLNSSGEVEAWFSGIRNSADLTAGGSAAPIINSFNDWNNTFSPTNAQPSGGFSLSYEMPMSRRQSASGNALRPLIDYNMRAVPASLNAAPATSVNHITPYYRVPTLVPARGAMKWAHFDLFHGFGATARENAMVNPQSVLMPAKPGNSRSTYGWAGPSPFATDGSAKGNARDEKTGAVYFDIPAEKPLSLGALRHAHVFDSVASPAYSVGTSYAPAFSANAVSVQDDLHRLNELLFDQYFFSTLSAASIHDPAAVLPSSRITRRTDTMAASTQTDGSGQSGQSTVLQSSQSAAAELMVDGAFNVNSTSVAAWRAVLASMRNTLADYRGSADLSGTPYPSLSAGMLANDTKTYHAGSNDADFDSSGANDIKTSERQYIYNGIRVLTDREIDILAQNIVQEITRRGQASGRPVLSMSEFVNRSLQPIGEEPVTQLKGLLQLAIDQGPWKNDTPSTVLNRWRSTDAQSRHLNADILKNDRIETSDQSLNGLVQAAEANQYPVNAAGVSYLQIEPRSAEAPAYLSQGDILSALAPILNARSDTFVIRAYGEATAPGSNQPAAKAWCEAVVQRLPDPVKRKSLIAGTRDYYEPDTGSADTLGRRFTILSFRWLPQEQQ